MICDMDFEPSVESFQFWAFSFEFWGGKEWWRMCYDTWPFIDYTRFLLRSSGRSWYIGQVIASPASPAPPTSSTSNIYTRAARSFAVADAHSGHSFNTHNLKSIQSNNNNKISKNARPACFYLYQSSSLLNMFMLLLR